MRINAKDLHRAIKVVKPHIEAPHDPSSPFGLHIEKCGEDIYVSTYRTGSMIVASCTDPSGNPDFHRQIHPESVDAILSWLPTVPDISITTDGDYLDFSSGEGIRLDASETTWEPYSWRDWIKFAVRDRQKDPDGRFTVAMRSDDLVRWAQSGDHLTFVPGTGASSIIVMGDNFVGIQALSDGSGIPVDQTAKILERSWVHDHELGNPETKKEKING